MHTLLQQLMQKRRVDPKDMTPEEKKTFDTWESKLQGKDMTLEKVVDFCLNQLSVIENQWENLDNSEKKNERLLLLHIVYQKIVKLIQSNEKEREELEKYLTELIDNDVGRPL